MVVDQPEYPRFNSLEEPDNPSPAMRKVLDSLYRASVEVYRTSYRLMLLHAIAKDKEFVQAVAQSDVRGSLFTLRSGLAYASVLSLAAVFDLDKRTASLRLVLRHLTNPQEEPALIALHAQTGTNVGVVLQVDRLRRFQRRLNNEAIKETLERLKLLRDQHLPHFDLAPLENVIGPTMGDLDRTFAFAANIVCTATRLAVKRVIQTRDIVQDARTQGQILTNAIKRGIS